LVRGADPRIRIRTKCHGSTTLLTGIKTIQSNLLMVPTVKSWPGAAFVEERMDFAPATVTSSSKLEDKDPSKHPMPFLNLILTAGLLDHDLVTMKLKKIYLFTNLIYLDGMLKTIVSFS
jgi:hypothetical protein